MEILKNTATEISVVTPVFNEQDNVREFYERTKNTLESMKIDFEILYVDDGSRDGTASLIRAIHDEDPRVKLVRFSRNFGHQISFVAGMDYSRGRFVATIDGDLQDPPEMIRDLYAKAKEGYDVVYAVRRKRPGEKFYRNWVIRLYYKIFSRVSNIRIPENVGDFRIISRRVCDKLKEMREIDPYLRGMVSWVGFRQTGIEYDRSRRKWGRSNYPFTKLIKLAWDGLTSYSTFPLRATAFLGFFVSGLSFLYMSMTLIKYFQYLVHPHIYRPLPGWATLIVLISFLGGVQLIALGVIGEYLYRIYMQTKKRPVYIVEQVAGFAQEFQEKKNP